MVLGVSKSQITTTCTQQTDKDAASAITVTEHSLHFKLYCFFSYYASSKCSHAGTVHFLWLKNYRLYLLITQQNRRTQGHNLLCNIRDNIGSI